MPRTRVITFYKRIRSFFKASFYTESTRYYIIADQVEDIHRVLEYDIITCLRQAI